MSLELKPYYRLAERVIHLTLSAVICANIILIIYTAQYTHVCHLLHNVVSIGIPHVLPVV